VNKLQLFFLIGFFSVAAHAQMGLPAGQAQSFVPSTSNTAVYHPSSFWNTPTPVGAAIDSNSASMVATALTPYASGAVLSNNAYGVGVIQASALNTVYTVTSLSGYVGPGQPTSVSFPVPSVVVPSTGSDGHLVVLGPPGTAYASEELDMWEACPPNTTYPGAGYSFPCPGTNYWTAGSVFISKLNGWGANAAPGTKAFGMYAAGYSGMGGMITPADIASGVIRHALSLATPKTLTHSLPPYYGPATEQDGSSGTYNIPEGAHIRLAPSFNIATAAAANSWSALETMIATALQTYGAYVSDTSGSLFLYGVTDANAGNTTWSSVGVGYDPSIAMPTGGGTYAWSNMQVVALATSVTTSSVALSPTGSLSSGTLVTLTFTMSAAVNVAGTPTLLMSTGETASYSSGSGSSTLIFKYTTATAESTTGLQIIALNVPGGATITDASGNAADLLVAIGPVPGSP